MGFEARIFGRPTPALSLSGGVQYLDAKLLRTSSAATRNNTPFNTPEWSGVLYADWKVSGLDGIFLNGIAKYVGPRQVSVPNFAEERGYMRFDLGIRYDGQLVGRDIMARAQVENVADRNYYVSAWSNLLEFGTPRTFTLSFDVKL